MLNTLMILTYLIGHPHGADDQHTPFVLKSPSFTNYSVIPKQHTCQGANLPIPLQWSGEPANTRSFALIMMDRNVPRDYSYHWAVFNIPPNQHSLSPMNLPLDAKVASNSWEHHHYDGPCSPYGEHQYTLQLYALDTPLPNSGNLTAVQLRQAMQGHVLSVTEIVGLGQPISVADDQAPWQSVAEKPDQP